MLLGGPAGPLDPMCQKGGSSAWPGATTSSVIFDVGMVSGAGAPVVCGCDMKATGTFKAAVPVVSVPFSAVERALGGGALAVRDFRDDEAGGLLAAVLFRLWSHLSLASLQASQDKASTVQQTLWRRSWHLRQRSFPSVAQALRGEAPGAVEW